MSAHSLFIACAADEDAAVRLVSIDLSRSVEPPPSWPAPSQVTVEHQTAQRLHIKIVPTDTVRWEVPGDMLPR